MRSFFLDISCRIPDDLGRKFAEQNVNTEFRRFAPFRQFNGTQIPLQVLFARIRDLKAGKARALEQSQCVGRSHQVGSTSIFRPGQRMVRIADRSQPMLGDREETSRFEDPVCLAEKGQPVRNIHRHMLRVSTIKSAIRVRQFLPVTMFDGNSVLPT